MRFAVKRRTCVGCKALLSETGVLPPVPLRWCLRGDSVTIDQVVCAYCAPRVGDLYTAQVRTAPTLSAVTRLRPGLPVGGQATGARDAVCALVDPVPALPGQPPPRRPLQQVPLPIFSL